MRFALKSYFCEVKIMEKYISRCIQVAKNGLGTSFPNPMVGSIIVHEDTIIGEGRTSPFGGPHAEVNAIHSVTDKSLLPASTLYVTLEPCSHYGKTPPCSGLIIAHKIPKVVIGIGDPHEKVNGLGIKKLRDAGCEVIVGVLEEQVAQHHKRFLCFHKKNRPFILLKWAQTQDGFLAPDTGKRASEAQPFWISNTYSQQLVHKWRSEEQAILVGARTVLEDNPKLNVRKWYGKSPVRIVLDKDAKIMGNLHVLDKSVKTLIISDVRATQNNESNVNYRSIDFSKNVAQQLCAILYEHNIISVLVEGGAKTLQTFIDEGFGTRHGYLQVLLILEAV